MENPTILMISYMLGKWWCWIAMLVGAPGWWSNDDIDQPTRCLEVWFAVDRRLASSTSGRCGSTEDHGLHLWDVLRLEKNVWLGPKKNILSWNLWKRRFLIGNPPFLGANKAVSFRGAIPKTNLQKPWESELRWVWGGEVEVYKSATFGGFYSVLLTGSFHTHPGNLGVWRTRAKVLFREQLEKTVSEKKLH